MKNEIKTRLFAVFSVILPKKQGYTPYKTHHQLRVMDTFSCRINTIYTA